MKKVLSFWNVLLLASAAMFVTSCTEEDPIDPTSPTLTESHTFDATQDVEAATTISFTLEGKTGGAPLNSIKISENDEVLATDRFTVDGATPVSGTIAMVGADKQGFTKTIEITLPETTGKYKYSFTVTDDNQKSDVVSLEVNVAGLTVITSERLYNVLGPFAGALNLSSGKAVLKGDNNWAGAHIIDQGNSGDAENHPWRAEIGNWDNAVLRQLPGTVDFDAPKNETQIKALYEGGTTVVSMGLEVGKIFTAFRDNEYFLVRVKSVVDDGKNSGADSNVDYSDFEIKKKG